MYNPRINPERRRLRATLLNLLAFALLASAAHALPEDASQPTYFESESSGGSLDLGIVILYGSAEKPARITQGSMVITGLEIRMESDNGVIKKVTATGTPAHFQQQPAADKELVHARALTLVFDNMAQMVTADGEAELIHAGNKVNSDHIDYDIQARSYRATSRPGENQVLITIPPATKVP